MPGKLSPQEVEFFRDQGYLLVHRPVLEPRRFQGLHDHFEQSLARWNTLAGASPEHMDVPHFADPKLFEWLFADELLDMVESLIGPDIVLWSSHFISKPAGVGKRVPWHEDSAYWSKILDPMEVVTIWLAIDPAMPENGCMRLIPRTHHNGYSQYEPVGDKAHSVFQTEIKAGSFDEKTAVDCALRPNECSIHHAKMIHGSEANTSAFRRCGYTMRYMPATSRFRPEAHKGGPFQIYLARGQDRAGNQYGDSTKINEGWVNANAEARRQVKLLAG